MRKRQGWLALVLAAGSVCAGGVEGPRELAVLQEVDVLVIGGGSGAVQAAVQAASDGASVFLAAPRPYLGDDIAGTLRLRLSDDAVPQTELCKALYAPSAEPGAAPKAAAEVTPMKVKKTFDAALLKAGVSFLTGCFATEPLRDGAGQVAGAVLANKSGRQAVIAKTVIDATERAVFCRASGARARPFPPGSYTFTRRVIATEAPRSDGMVVKEALGIYPVKIGKEKVDGRLYECAISLPVKDGAPASFAEAEQKARDMTFVPGVLDASDSLFFVPPDPLVGRATSEEERPDAAAVALEAFRPQGLPYVFVLGPMADVSRAAAQAFSEPARAMVLGERIGRAAAAESKTRETPAGVGLAGTAGASGAPTTVRASDIPGTIHVGAVAKSDRRVPAAAHALPELAACDVLVVGGGTGGAPAAIAAARRGAKVIVCEYLYHLGGVQTVGLIGGYYYGNICGFTDEIDAGVKEMAKVKVMGKSEWYRRQCRANGAEIWYGTLATGAMREGDTLVGVIVVAPDGRRGVIRAKAVIDGTGNADIAAAAGEETEYFQPQEIALQGAGNAPRRLGSSGANSDIGFVDETDAADLCYFALRSRLSLPVSLWDQAQNVNSRERRRLVGAFYMTPLDVINRRTYPDTVMQSHSDIDSHGYTTHENFFVVDFGRKKFFGANFPYRAMLPKKLDGLLVIGLGVSAHRDAMPVLRMQPDIQNQGYAAGCAAAMAVKANVPLRAIDVKALQRHLVEIKNLDASVLTAQDSYPIVDDQLAGAVRCLADLTNHYEKVAAVLAEPLRAMPLLETAYRQAESETARLNYAHLLGIMGNPLGEATLIAKLESSGWDAGWNFKGMSQFGRSVSWVDSYMIALGRCRSKKALPALLKKAAALTADSAFSHFRATAMALERLGDVSAAPALAAVLDKPGIRGQAFTLAAMREVPGHANAAADQERSECLREIALARALVRLGDCEGKGRSVLRAYADDPRGVYARHAKAVLAE